MPKIIFISPDQVLREVRGVAGSSAMAAARLNGVAGIEAECAGSLSCGPCHVYVTPEFVSKLPAASEQEQEMLEFVVAERRAGSRLSCQIMLTDELDGLTLEIPEKQSRAAALSAVTALLGHIGSDQKVKDCRSQAPSIVAKR